MAQNLSSGVNRIVYGFYNGSNFSSIQWPKLTHVANMAVTMDGSGELYENGQYSLAFTQAKADGVVPILGIACLNTSAVTAFLSNSSNFQNTIGEIISDMGNTYQGVCIDFEYVKPSYQSAFVTFMSNLANQVYKSNPPYSLGYQVTAYLPQDPSLYGNSTMAKGYDVADIAQATDGWVVGAYDYSGPVSTPPGPNAPLYSSTWPNSQGQTEIDNGLSVDNTIQNLLVNQVPSGFLVLACPYYGYGWPTNSTSEGASILAGYTYNTWFYGNVSAPGIGNIASWVSLGGGPFVDSYGVTFQVQITKTWEPTPDTGNGAESPWFYFSFLDSLNNKNYYQTWYDNVQSLGLKYNYANSNNLAGIGIWALGYDAPQTELWGLLQNTFQKQLPYVQSVTLSQDTTAFYGASWPTPSPGNTTLGNLNNSINNSIDNSQGGSISLVIGFSESMNSRVNPTISFLLADGS